ncbi:MAG: hypothetical protein ACXVDB_04390 [Tumebacillaceae bacterium]
MTFWGFLFMALLVFVAFYAWYRFARRGMNAPRLSGQHTQVHRTNQALMTETGTIGEREQMQSIRPKRKRSAAVQKYLTEVGTIGDVQQQPQRRPIAGYLPAPKQDFSTEAGTIGDVEQVSQAQLNPNHPQHAIASVDVGSNLSQAQLNPNHDQSEWLENSDLERLQQQQEQSARQRSMTGDNDELFDNMVNSVGNFMEEVGESLGTEFAGLGYANNNSRNHLHEESLNSTASRDAQIESLESNRSLTQAEQQARHGDRTSSTSMTALQGTEGTDALAQSNQQAAAYESSVSGQPSGQSQSYQQARVVQDFSTEVGLIGETGSMSAFTQQGPRNSMRRGYVHSSDVEIGVLEHDEGIDMLPDQLPVLNPRTFKDPDCK